MFHRMSPFTPKRRQENGPPRVATRKVRDEYRGWTYEVTRRSVGVTVARPQFSVAFWNRDEDVREFFSGFSSQQAALEAVHERVNFIEGKRERIQSDKIRGPSSGDK